MKIEKGYLIFQHCHHNIRYVSINYLLDIILWYSVVESHQSDKVSVIDV